MAKYEEIKQGTIFPAGVLNPYGEFFVGDTYLTNLVTSPDDKIGVGSVSFEPGSRNNWHIHHDGYQILLVTAGEGWYQEEGKEAVSLSEGSVVVIPANVKHWHGAKKDSWFSHIALGVPGEDLSSEWCEAVSDEEYHQLKD